jgi:HEAT repeat protein
MAKIYVSSTYKDLRTCRRRVSEAIRMLGHHDIAMEYYVAESRRTVDKCLSDVAACDIYVGIFARRYGWIPPGSNLSITEMEYRQAVRCQKDILLFLLGEDIRNWPESDAETSENGARLKALRAELTSGECMHAYFSSCSDLAIKLTAAIANLTSPPLTPGDIEREEKLLEVLNSKEPVARSRASEALIEMGSTRYAALLQQRLSKRHVSKERRIKDLKNLLEIVSRRSSVMPLLRSLLKHDDPATRAWIVGAIGQRGQAGKPVDSDSVRGILDLSSDSNVLVRREVAHAIWKLPRDARLLDEMNKCLHKLLRDEDNDVRQLAAYSSNQLWRSGLR